MRYVYFPDCVTFIPEIKIEQIIRHRDGSGWEVLISGSDEWEVCEPKFYKNPFKGV